MALARLGRSALGGGGAAVGEFVEQRAPGGAVGGVGGRIGPRRAGDHRHGRRLRSHFHSSALQDYAYSDSAWRIAEARDGEAGRDATGRVSWILRVVDMAHAVLVEAVDVDEFVARPHVLRGEGVARMDGLRRRFVEASDADDEIGLAGEQARFRSRRASGLSASIG